MLFKSPVSFSLFPFLTPFVLCTPVIFFLCFNPRHCLVSFLFFFLSLRSWNTVLLFRGQGNDLPERSVASARAWGAGGAAGGAEGSVRSWSPGPRQHPRGAPGRWDEEVSPPVGWELWIPSLHSGGGQEGGDGCEQEHYSVLHPAKS